MAIKAIIFDCFGVLVMSGRAMLYHDFPLFKDQIHDLERQSDYGMISRPDFNTGISELTGLSVDVIEARYWATSVVNDSAFELIKELRRTGLYKIGLLSNIGRGWVDDFMSVDARGALFDGEVLSSEVGIVKPAVEIYEIAARRLNVEPYECIMIDDILQNVDGAERAGMKGVLFETTTEARAEIARHLENQDA